MAWRTGVAILSLCVLLTVALCAPALADDTALGTLAGSVFPVASADIRLEAETVQAMLHDGYAEFQVGFRFVNDGAQQTVDLGFPYLRYEDEGDAQGTVPLGFQAWQEGEPLKVWSAPAATMEGLAAWPGAQYTRYLVHTVTFAPGPTHIRIRYLAAPSVSAGRRFHQEAVPPELREGWVHWYEYFLHSGELWKGPIGRAVVRFTMGEDFRGEGAMVTRELAAGWGEADEWQVTHPDGFTTPEAATLQWVFEDFEPGADPKVGEDDSGYFPYDIYLYYSDSAPYPSEEYKGKSPFVSAVRASTGTVGEGGENVPNAPDRAADRSLWEAWVVDNGGGGRGEWLEFDLVYADEIKEVCIVGGDLSEPGSFQESARPKTCLLTFSDGSSYTLELADEPGAQRFAVDARDVTSARLEIVDSYPGTQSTALYLAEVQFTRRPAAEFDSFETLLATSPMAISSTTGTTAAATTTGSTTTSSTVASTTVTVPGLQSPSLLQDRWFRSPVVWLVLGVALLATLLGWLIVRKQG
ncbi:MAG: hypothetical protein GXX83_00300 [Gaiellales bacterium]|nr:hypothetical protein [Gaiellales bacterium]